jgi:hypothetical protein
MALTLRDWTLWTRPGQRWPNWCRFLERLSGCVVAAAQTPSSPPAQTQQAPATAPGNSAAGIASLSGLPSRDTYCKPIGQHWGKCFLVLGCQHPARDASRARTQESVRSNHGTVSSPLQRGARQSWPSACVRTCRSPQATGRRDSCYITTNPLILSSGGRCRQGFPLNGCVAATDADSRGSRAAGGAVSVGRV